MQLGKHCCTGDYWKLVGTNKCLLLISLLSEEAIEAFHTKGLKRAIAACKYRGGLCDGNFQFLLYLAEYSHRGRQLGKERSTIVLGEEGKRDN